MYNETLIGQVAPIKSRPTYTGGQLIETKLRYKNRNVHHVLCKCTVHSAETDGLVGKQVRGAILSMKRNFKYSNGSVASRKFQTLVHTCGERMEVGSKKR